LPTITPVDMMPKLSTDPLQRTGALQELAAEIAAIQDVLSCTIINENGTLEGQVIGALPNDREVWETAGQVSAVIWSSFKKVEPIGGRIKVITAEYENLKLIGFPVPKTTHGVIVAVPVHLDVYYMRDRILQYVLYWFGGR
jgi:hypothetical protein